MSAVHGNEIVHFLSHMLGRAILEDRAVGMFDVILKFLPFALG